jgi:hypothetical protein
MRDWARIATLAPGRTATHRTFAMDAERINLINNQIIDLSNRVNELRGYL